MVLAMGLLVIGILSRFLPHAMNFTPVLAIALFGGVYLRRSQAIWLPLALMVLSDLVIGLHSTIAFTWGSVLLTSLIGIWVRQSLTPVRVVTGAVASAVSFFMITNFGSWLVLYPQTSAGLLSCYTLAVPFFRMTLASTMVYVVILFGMYSLVSRRVEKTRLAPVLLSK